MAPLEAHPVGPGVISFEAFGDPLQVLRAHLTVTLDGPDEVRVECVAPDVIDERHVLMSPSAEIHELALFGLLAETTYDCAAMPLGGGGTAETTFTTDTLPPGIPQLAVEHHGTPWGVWTMGSYSPPASPAPKLLIYDIEGRIRWFYDFPVALPGIEVTLGPDGNVFAGGGPDISPRSIGLDWELRMEMPPAGAGDVYHHDCAWTDEEQVLALASTPNGNESYSWEGFQLQLRDSTSGQLTWSWDSQSAVDEALLPEGAFASDDAYHANAVSLVEDALGEAFYVSLAAVHRVLRIDRTTGQVTWQLGLGQDFTLLDGDGVELIDPAEWFFFQHDPEWNPATGTLLLHDNGDAGSFRPDGVFFSRVLELELDPGARTAQIVWDWREDGWYSPIMGDADRLPNGHVLVTQNICLGCGGDVHPDRRTSVVEVDPTTDEIVWRVWFTARGDMVYRSERLDGCALFAHAGYCDALR